MRTSYEDARLRLSRLRMAETATDGDVLRIAARISAQALHVDRVGIWLLDPAGAQLDCQALFERAKQSYVDGTTILRTHAPTYFAALTERRVVATRDARQDLVTRELTGDYLAPRGIGAMLDAPLYVDGELIGVVCHEHIGGTRDWTAAEIDFAGTFADILSALFLQRRLRRQELAVRAAASQLADAQRIAHLTQVVRTLAHDVNNALTVAALHAGRLAQHASPEVASVARDLQVASEFGSRVLRELQQFAARGETDVVAIGDVLERFQPMLRALVRDHVTLDVIVSDPELVPTASRTQLEQILMNLCVNARDASPVGGNIVLRARQSDDGLGLVLEVKDRGTGIAPELRGRIFEPYVTSKPDGSGLGLSIVRTIVEDLGGAIELDTAVGAGTTFRVVLPLSTGAAR